MHKPLRRYKELFTIVPRRGQSVELMRRVKGLGHTYERVITSPIVDLVETVDNKWLLETENTIYVPE